MSLKAADPYSVILRRKKLPMGLLVESQKAMDGGRTGLLEVESFSDAFDGKRQRKRPKVEAQDLDQVSWLAWGLEGGGGVSTWVKGLVLGY
jgi:nuclear GTP-binding protein